MKRVASWLILISDTVTHSSAPELLRIDFLRLVGPARRGVGCIQFEMYTGRPMFAGTAVENQLATIFKLLGAPDERRWPGYERLLAEFERARSKQAAASAADGGGGKEPAAPMPDPSLNSLLDELTGAAARAGLTGRIPPEYLIQRLAPRCAWAVSDFCAMSSC